ncbi:hypothetical protein GSI_08579 [Ganoderma sinense ZZ0214-1]|uniref:Uncharacterized protein n=1 Tax=Ganoderma sinense ZZ0214-1 TaxID=1077348 RepID=A0A2G8S4P1_9APHY|nr:hypothetical protein GSI_08579 [Ganoderma sinense ZZ0214-1]
MPSPTKPRSPRKGALPSPTNSIVIIDYPPLSPMSFVARDSNNSSLVVARGTFTGTSIVGGSPPEPQYSPADSETWRLRPLPPIPKPEKRMSPLALTMTSPLSAPAIARRVSPFLTRVRSRFLELGLARRASDGELQPPGAQSAHSIGRRGEMASAQLNVDILEVISEFLTEVPDVLSFSLTSILVHQIAIRRLLSMRPIFLSRNAESLYRFHSFVFADAPARAPYVRALDIESGSSCLDLAPGQPDSTPLLLEILSSCPNIRSVIIVLGENKPDGLAYDLDIAHAIAALPRLRSLTLFSSDMSRAVLLHDLRAALRTLSLWGYTEDIRIYHPAALETFLPRIAPNLEKLEIGEFTVDPEEIQAWGIAPTPVFTLIRYPTVRSLSFQLFGEPLLDHLQHLFPALDGTLSFLPLHSHDNALLERCVAIRAANQRAQESSRSRPWKKLDRIVCEPPMLYLLGLRCPVKHVILGAMDVPLEPYAVDALRENPVPRLKLTLRLQSPAFASLCTPELAETLTHLNLRLVYPFQTLLEPENPAETPGPPLWQDVLDEVVSSLHPLHRLTHLRVVVRADASTRSIYWDHDNVKPIIARARAYVRSFHESVFDFDGTAAALARPLRSLKYVFVETDGSFRPDNCDVDDRVEWWHATRGWRVAGEYESGPRLVGLHCNVVETIIRKEELAVCEADFEDEDF